MRVFGVEEFDVDGGGWRCVIDGGVLWTVVCCGRWCVVDGGVLLTNRKLGELKVCG